MAAAPPVKRSKPAAPPPSWQHKHGPNAYVAKVVSLQEVWRVVQGGAGSDAAVAWVADRQLGLITTPQLHAAGAPRGSVEWRLAAGDFHRPRPAFERDHRRDIVHTDAGHEVVRVSGQQLDQEPLYIATVIAKAYDRLSRTRG